MDTLSFSRFGSTSRRPHNTYLKRFCILPREDNFGDPAHPKVLKDMFRSLAQVKVSGRDFLLCLTIYALGLLGGVCDSLFTGRQDFFIQNSLDLRGELIYEGFKLASWFREVRFRTPNHPSDHGTGCFDWNGVILKTGEVIVSSFMTEAIRKRKICIRDSSFRRGACLQGVRRLSATEFYSCLASDNSKGSYLTMLASSLISLFCRAILKEMMPRTEEGSVQRVQMGLKKICLE